MSAVQNVSVNRRVGVSARRHADTPTRRHSLLLAAVLCMGGQDLPAAALSLVWDPPSDGVALWMVYEVRTTTVTNLLLMTQTIITNFVPVALTGTTNLSLAGRLGGGVHVLGVTAFASNGLESAMSALITTPFIPFPPANPGLHMSAALESAGDVGGPWTELAMIDFPPVTLPIGNGFYRVRLSQIP